MPRESRSRSRSPSGRRKRSRERRRRRDRSRSSERSGRPRDRTRSPRHERDRSPRHDRDYVEETRPEQVWNRERERVKKKEKEKELPSFSGGKTFTASQMEGKSNEEVEMMKLMGFTTFDSTKNKKVEGNAQGAVHVVVKRKYRQYMNRKGGFNRPLDFVH